MMQYHAEHADVLYLVPVHHRAHRSQQDLHQSQVVVASSHMQTCVTRLKAQEPVQSHVLSCRRAECTARCWRTHVVLGVRCGSTEQQEASSLSMCILTRQVERCVSCLHQHDTVGAALHFELLVRTVAECNSTFSESAV